jgi:hypothetical protein
MLISNISPNDETIGSAPRNVAESSFAGIAFRAKSKALALLTVPTGFGVT